MKSNLELVTAFEGIFLIYVSLVWLPAHSSSPPCQVLCPRTELTLCNGHDSREGGHDEVLRLLGIMVGQAVDICQGADRWQTSS